MFCTVYGELRGDKIKTEKGTYQLTKHSNVIIPAIGWFQLCKQDNKWELIRILRESDAEVLPNWNEDFS